MSDQNDDFTIASQQSSEQNENLSAEQKRRAKILSIKDSTHRNAIQTMMADRDNKRRALLRDQEREKEGAYRQDVNDKLKPTWLNNLTPPGMSTSWDAKLARIRMQVEARYGPIHKDQRLALYTSLTKEIDGHIDTALKAQERPLSPKERREQSEAKRSEFRQTSRDVASQAPKPSGQSPSGPSR